MSLAYIDALIRARREGLISDHVHLGLFATGQPPSTLADAQDAMSLHHLALLGARNGDTVVDVGAGFGGTLRLLDRTLLDAHLHGVNIDPRQVALARAAPYRNRITWHVADGAAFSEGRQGWADRILSLEALFHFPDPAGFFRSAAQALRPGGRLVVSTILFEPSLPDTRPAMAVVTSGYSPWPHPDMTLARLHALAGAAGLVAIGCEDVSGLCRPCFEWMSPACPPQPTDNPVVELRRLFECGAVRYPVMVFTRPSHGGGKTQK